MKLSKIYLAVLIAALLPFNTLATPTAVEDKVAVLITGWGMPAGYSLSYSWHSSEYARCGDKTEYEGQPCKFGHVGEVPYQSHMGMIPFAICFETEGWETSYDNSGIYILEDGVYVSPNPEVPSVLPEEIPEDVPVIALVEYEDHTGKLVFLVDPRTGEDYLEGWYKIGDTRNPFSNGFSDLAEQGPAYFTRYIGFITGPTELPDAHQQNPYAKEMEDYTEQMLEDAFGESVDVRVGYYGEVTGYSELHWDVAEQFALEGFTKMLLARETTDHNNYANKFFTLNYVKESLCEIDKLDDIQILQTYQVGRTPEFNTMNIMNMKKFIEAYPEGSTIAIVYATRGLPWGQDEPTDEFGRAHPWSKEIYFENAYLNYLSWKKAVQDAYGDNYNLVFTKGGVENNLREDNLFTFGLSTEIDLLGYEEEHVYYGLRDAIEFAVEDGIDKIIIAPCHWNYDNLDTIMRMKEINDLPLTPKADLEVGVFEMTHCEDAEGNQVECSSAEAVAEITVAPSYSLLAEEFATAYYVVLRGTLERFGLFPAGEEPVIETSQTVTKLAGGTVEVTSAASSILGAKIEIPADPYPDRPQGFTPETALAVNDPTDTNDCMWEDTEISIGYLATPPTMNGVKSVGPAFHFGPYRTFFNRDVTISIPYNNVLGGTEGLMVYIYNHLSKDWDPIQPLSVDTTNKLVTFKTQVLGLFQVAAELCPTEQIYGQDSDEVTLLRGFRDSVLEKTPEGREVIRLYYEWGPEIAKLVKEDEGFKERMKTIIDGVLPLIRAGVK